MQVRNYITLEFPSRSANEGFCPLGGGGLAAQPGPDAGGSWGTSRPPSVRR